MKNKTPVTSSIEFYTIVMERSRFVNLFIVSYSYRMIRIYLNEVEEAWQAVASRFSSLWKRSILLSRNYLHQNDTMF